MRLAGNTELTRPNSGEKPYKEGFGEHLYAPKREAG